MTSTTRHAVEFVSLGAATWLIYKALQSCRTPSKATELRGPPRESWLHGSGKKEFFSSEGLGEGNLLLERCAEQYGLAYHFPGPLGTKTIVLMDPKSIAHFYAKGSTVYVFSKSVKNTIHRFVGRGLFSAEGDDHRRQRKSLAPAFSTAAIRDVTHVFFNSAYKLKDAWDAQNVGLDEFIIDVQTWMNRISLDSIGIAGFGHDFNSLEGESQEMTDVFDSFYTPNLPSGFILLIFMLQIIFPIFSKIPTKMTRLQSRMNATLEGISRNLMKGKRSEGEVASHGQLDVDRSVMGTLLKAESSSSKLKISEEELLAQMKTLLVAGYETTSISLTWALIELARHADKQDKLRKELCEFSSSDPLYDQLTDSLPYLNAVTLEILRLRSPAEATQRVAACDDVIPLSKPITNPSGEQINEIIVPEGSTVLVPISAINCSEAIWGPDAKAFNPERWLSNGEDVSLPSKVKDIQGYHHLLTFADGPRMCIGRAFAVAEFKAVLFVLIRNYVFSMRDGPETKIEMVATILPRPKIAGEEGYAVPLRVRRAE
ncbi:cytochrome P450 [Fomitiporia mediterranea MF3/22]|uniref:cytochrome P450 n=1 Tax=Fomitiporia mediterranea (strain MF3/22) TaxID=694068 RepID=UPI00044097BB|nr:cytochrome P450 [Fomitiporia mediterranea MF3/22]EJD00152.1 cytochrome P450 [Fomitiporia mediterranea MF3/22]